MRSLIRVIRSLIARTRFERDMREELASHVDHRADDLVASGMSREAAKRQARLEFGALEAYKEQCRDAGGLAPGRVLHGFSGDLKLAFRRLLATPVFSIFAVLSLALGVGVTTAVYSIVDRIFWKESGIADPDRVVFVMNAQSGAYDVRRAMSEPDFADLKGAQTSFRMLSASQTVFPAVANGETTEIEPAEAVDGTYFSLLGVTASRGRLIQAADNELASQVVVLSDALWRTRFRSDAGILGRTVRLSGRPFEVVGIAPVSFEGATPGLRAARLWVPFAVKDAFTFGSAATPAVRDRRGLTVAGRLAPDRTVAAASEELAAISAALDAEHPPARPLRAGVPAKRGWRARTVDDLNARDDGLHKFGVVVFSLILLVLVVACTNLANLVLARGAARQKECAVRRALGASRWRLVREQASESLILAVVGGIASWVLIQALIRIFDFEIPMGRAWITVSIQPEINPTALAVSAGALLLSLIVFGLEPAFQLTTRADVRADLAEGSSAVGVPKARRQRMLLRCQVAISAGFFIIATLCVRYLAAEARHDSGMDLDRMGIAAIDFYVQRKDEQQARSAIDRILESVRQEPGVRAVAASSGLPFGTTMNPWLRISRPDIPLTNDSEDAKLIIATSDFFKVSGISVLRGRAFDDRDDAGAPPVVILSESTARRLLGTADVVGRQIQIQVDTLSRGIGVEQPVRTATVIGIAEDTDTTHFFSERRGDTAYAPHAQAYMPSTTIVVRADAGSTAVGALRRALNRAAPDLGAEYVASGRTALAGPFVFLRGAGIIAVVLGAVTLLLAMVGLYGVQSHIVAHRTREIGVRMSLGATAAQIRRMVLADGYRPVVQGLAIGLFIGVVGRALVRSFVVARMDVIDPWMLALVPVPLLLAAFCACFLPAYRASRVDPNVALRHL